jgi:glycosyltransferase involved in cell wall biosynthesis
LEALAAGTPVVMPDHGAFGELIASTGGGQLVPPGDTGALARALLELRKDAEKRRALAAAGQAAVRQKHSIELAAESLAQLIGGSSRAERRAWQPA